MFRMRRVRVMDVRAKSLMRFMRLRGVRKGCKEEKIRRGTRNTFFRNTWLQALVQRKKKVAVLGIYVCLPPIGFRRLEMAIDGLPQSAS